MRSRPRHASLSHLIAKSMMVEGTMVARICHALYIKLMTGCSRIAAKYDAVLLLAATCGQLLASCCCCFLLPSPKPASNFHSATQAMFAQSASVHERILMK